MKNVVYAVVRIEYNDNGTFPIDDDELKDEAAIGLAINPNFHTVESGVSLKSVYLNQVTPYEPSDWDSLENCPDQIYVKQ